MTKIPVLTSRDVIKGLKKAGFEFDRQAKESHEIWYNPNTKRRTIIPNHPGIENRPFVRRIFAIIIIIKRMKKRMCFMSALSILLMP